MIISGGLNVYPKEVENLIDELEEVLESAVIGVPHPDLGEGVVAVVVLRRKLLDPKKIQETVQTRLAKCEQPKFFIYLEKLPRNAMGKIQKAALRKQYEQIFES